MGTVAALGFVASRVARARRATVLGIYLEHSVSNLTVCKILAKISTSSERKKSQQKGRLLVLPVGLVPSIFCWNTIHN